jgi:cell wall-associated NlpC family hydrolase
MLRKLFPCALAACLMIFVYAVASAQSPEANVRPSGVTINSTGSASLETEPTVAAPVEERRPRVTNTSESPLTLAPGAGRFDQLLLSSIQSHLGATYHYNTTGPDTFDCSGFVWSTFQEAGLSFTRGPARSYWATFAPATKEEEKKFGTLVFFSGLTHVGIVADEKGFYHASRHHGVVYSPFNDYWLSRIDGFRRVPLKDLQIPSAKDKEKTTAKGLQRGATTKADSDVSNR